MSPAKRNIALQESFVKTQLETGYRMLALAASQRSHLKDDAAVSLSMARLALSGAENHLAAVGLPRSDAKEILHEVRKLRREIASFEADGGARAAQETRRPRKKRTQKTYSRPAV